MMEAPYTCETLVNFYQTTWCYNPEDSHRDSYHHENLKSYMMFLGFTWFLYLLQLEAGSGTAVS
jgi:hypothetical protein